MIVDIDAFKAVLLGHLKHLMHDSKSLELAIRNPIVPPVPCIAVDRRERESVDVFDRSPVGDSGVLVAAVTFRAEPRGHAHKAGGLVGFELSDHAAEAVADLFEAFES